MQQICPAVALPVMHALPFPPLFSHPDCPRCLPKYIATVTATPPYRVKAEEPFPDLYTTPAPTLVPKSEFCYKTARRADARDKVLMPRDEGVRAKDMYSLFSHAPYRTNAAALASPATGRGQGGKGEEEGDVHSVWMALLRGRVLRAGKRKEQQQAAKAAAQAAGGGQQGGAAARPTASTTGPAESALGGDDDGTSAPLRMHGPATRVVDMSSAMQAFTRSGGQPVRKCLSPFLLYSCGPDSAGAPYFNGADGGGDTFDHHDDDAGAYDAGGGASGSYDSFTHGDDDDGGYAGEGCGYGGGGDSRDIGVDPRTATFRQLLQPPRRVQRVTVKFDKSAGLADVRALKENLHSSLRWAPAHTGYLDSCSTHKVCTLAVPFAGHISALAAPSHACTVPSAPVLSKLTALHLLTCPWPALPN